MLIDTREREVGGGVFEKDLVEEVSHGLDANKAGELGMSEAEGRRTFGEGQK